jgi:hypothetical protein
MNPLKTEFPLYLSYDACVCLRLQEGQYSLSDAVEGLGTEEGSGDHILIRRRQQSSILDVRSFRTADCDTGHYLVVAKVRERLAVSKQTMHRVHIERFNLKKKQYPVEISNRFTALENLDTEVDIITAWETIRENIEISVKESLGYYQLKKHKPRFYEGCSKLSHQRKKPNCSGYRTHAK